MGLPAPTLQQRRVGEHWLAKMHREELEFKQAYALRVHLRRPWRCMCDGCGAPLQRAEVQCSYCLRATMQPVSSQPSPFVSQQRLTDAQCAVIRREWALSTNSTGPR